MNTALLPSSASHRPSGDHVGAENTTPGSWTTLIAVAAVGVRQVEVAVLRVGEETRAERGRRRSLADEGDGERDPEKSRQDE